MQSLTVCSHLSCGSQNSWIILQLPNDHIFTSYVSALGYEQPKTQVKIENGIAAQLLSDTIKNKHSKSWDTFYHWLTEQQANRDFHIYSDGGKNNLADYHT